jgi:hypothetical protein
MTQTRADGAAGARRASALLGIAACAETTHTTLDEDSAKVDMKLSFRHAYQPEKLLTATFVILVHPYHSDGVL